MLEEVNKDLNTIAEELSKDEEVQFASMRKFIVDYMQLDVADLYMFYAFKAPKDELFYLPADSDEWQRLAQATTVIGIQNAENYKWKLRLLLDTVCASGAAVFKALEDDNFLK